ncbi:MAG: hypothetical protein O3A00_11920 [Planctomycetota bacterium]|nr:hypothetical protein [Planctomycetota bacterium]
MLRLRAWISVGVLMICANPLLADEADAKRNGPLTHAEFLELHKELQPADEPWRTIPWKIALLDAQRSAAELKQPIFIWAMDGHPLGCT